MNVLPQRIGIMGAMLEEVALLEQQMENTTREVRGLREYLSGVLCGFDVVVVFSRWGKVAASSTATTLVEHFHVDLLLFTGVAGGLDPSLRVGDIVIADALIQHDLDVSLLEGIERFEIPLLGVAEIQVPERLVQLGVDAATKYLNEDLASDVSAEALSAFAIQSPRVVSGLIASGDQFIADPAITSALLEQLPALTCVEMEGAAVAQVAYEHGLPFVVMRTISDSADHDAVADFPRFLEAVASHFTCGSVIRFLKSLAT